MSWGFCPRRCLYQYIFANLSLMKHCKVTLSPLWADTNISPWWDTEFWSFAWAEVKRETRLFSLMRQNQSLVNSTRKSFRTSWINEDKTHPFSLRIRVWERPLAVEITCWCVWLCRLSEHIDAVNPLQRQGFVWLDDLLWCWMPYLGNTLGQVHWSVHWTVIPGTKLNELHKKTDSS